MATRLTIRQMVVLDYLVKRRDQTLKTRQIAEGIEAELPPCSVCNGVTVRGYGREGYCSQCYGRGRFRFSSQMALGALNRLWKLGLVMRKEGVETIGNRRVLEWRAFAPIGDSGEDELEAMYRKRAGYGAERPS